MSSVNHRHYRVPGLNFRDFWDICSQYQRVQPKYRSILYTVEGFGITICQDEDDVSVVLSTIAEHANQVRRYVARFYLSPHSEPGDYGNAKLEYLPESYDFIEPGLHLYNADENKLVLYHFEDYILNSYSLDEDETADVEYGLPCEVLSAVIDMRGFSSFGEQPSIESPYTCGVMTAFYSMVSKGFKRYPPDLVKFLGDGVLAVWQTTSKDRSVAIEVCLEGLSNLPNTWKQIIRSPEFTHGAPPGIGSGVSFGLASKLMIDHDYIGRPINVASRLCGICPPGKTYISRDVPEVREHHSVKPISVNIKSYGDTKIFMLDED